MLCLRGKSAVFWQVHCSLQFSVGDTKRHLSLQLGWERKRVRKEREGVSCAAAMFFFNPYYFSFYLQKHLILWIHPQFYFPSFWCLCQHCLCFFYHCSHQLVSPDNIITLIEYVAGICKVISLSSVAPTKGYYLRQSFVIFPSPALLMYIQRE